MKHYYPLAVRLAIRRYWVDNESAQYLRNWLNDSKPSKDVKPSNFLIENSYYVTHEYRNGTK
jgi:hypothetical protein